jgi:molybdopterin-guanine dinucleotide biosynthesis protein A
MGRDKALVELGGQPLISRAVAILRDAGLDVAIAGSRSALDAYAPVVADDEPGWGPLSGICAALRSTSARWAVFLSVDLPLIPAGIITYLLAHAHMTGGSVTLASVNGYPQTFPAVVLRGALPVFQDELRGGGRGCFSAFKAAAAAREESVSILPIELLVQAGQVFHAAALPPARWFLNINSEADLRRAADSLPSESCKLNEG